MRFCLGLSRKAEDPAQYHQTMWLAVRSIFESASDPNQASTERRDVMEVFSQLGTSLKRASNSCTCMNPQKRPRVENAAVPTSSSLSASSSYGRGTCLGCQSSSTNTVSSNSETQVMGPPRLPRPSRPGPNFCTAHNLCTHISHISGGQETENSTKACFGHLERPPVIHELYFENQRKATEISCSLQDWVKGIGERDRTEQVPVLECLRLARHLALFVL